ncbi:MAG: carbamoyltransferase [Verrucomicrobiia bacterium]
MNILGISAFYHDSAAALVHNGEIVAAAQEERFTRVKHDARFPLNAVKYCLAEGRVGSDGLGAVAFYDKPLLKFDRILKTYFSVAPKGLRSFMMAMPVWLKQKLWISLEIERSLQQWGVKMPRDLYFPEHHESHAASAFYPSPHPRAAILTLDGVGEWATTTMGIGEDNRVQIIREIRFPHSLGLLYSAFTYFAGFKVNSGEYKLMGLAPFGEPKYVDVIREHLIDIRDDGSFQLNMDYFGYLDGLEMTNQRFHDLFGGQPRKPDAEITQRAMDLARSIQVVTEEVVLKMARHLHKVTNMRQLCMAGGVALNCVANGRLLREGPFNDVWVQPAAGDAGGAIGAALIVWHQIKNQPRSADGAHDKMHGSLLGPAFSDDENKLFLEQNGYPAHKLAKSEWAATIATLIDEQKVVGLFQGRMEFGPRALGARSIIGDPRSASMQSTLNLKIKYRESFRPFAPACLAERVSDFFELDRASPYMLLVAPVKQERLRQNELSNGVSLRDRIHQVRSDIPAVTHVDCSARIQTVDRESNPRFYEILKAFEERTGYGVVINTSFNVRGEPIVCTPEDAYKCFMRTGMDYLVLGSYLLDKNEQPSWSEKQNWREDYVLD